MTCATPGCGHSILYHLFAQVVGKCLYAACQCEAYKAVRS